MTGPGRQRAPLSRRKRLCFGILAVALTLILVMIVGEIAIRALHVMDNVPLLDRDGRSIYARDPELRYAMRPHAEALFRQLEFSIAIKTNALGYRDEEFAMPPDPNQFVIAGLGDSFAWGHGVEVEEGFYQVAEHLLRERDPRVRIDNLAVNGYCQLQHERQIAAARRLGARWVVMAVCTSNDVLENDGLIVRELGENQRRADKMTNRRFENAPPAATSGNVPGGSLLSRLHCVRFLLSRIHALRPNLGVGTADWYVIDATRRNPDTRTQQAFANTEELMHSILRQCRESGMRLAVVTVPLAWETSDERFRESLESYGLSGEELDRRRVTDFYLEFCRANGVPCLDLIEALRSRSHRPETYFYPLDRHLNRQGQRLAGEAIAGFLVRDCLNEANPAE